MKKHLKLFCLAAGLLLSVGAGFAQSGTTGPLNWSLSGGTLSISGEGAMPNYSVPPWNSYRSSITRVVIGTGVTSIGSNAFSACSNIVSVTIPERIYPKNLPMQTNRDKDRTKRSNTA